MMHYNKTQIGPDNNCQQSHLSLTARRKCKERIYREY